MPAKRTSKKKSATATEIQNRAAAERRAKTTGKRQIRAIILFAISIFLLFVALIPGQRVWLSLHNFMFGMFGICTYVWPVVLGLVAILCAIDKLYGNISAKVIEACILVGFIGAAIDIFRPHLEGEKFWQHVSNAYTIGKEIKNGGLIGALIGHPFYSLFGNPGASITISILIFVFFMLITGTTLVAFFKMLSKPVKKIEAVAENVYNQHAERNKSEENKKIEIDIPLDEKEEQQRSEDDFKAKKQKLFDTYNDNNTRASEHIDEVEEPETQNSGEDELINKINQTIEKKKKEVETGGFAPPNEKESQENKEDSYNFPPISLLTPVKKVSEKSVSLEMESTATRLIDTLRSFGVETRIIDISRGPAVTRYELQPSAGVKISKITGLADDIALNLASAGVRIEAPIPNKPAVGIEVPNKTVATVSMREVIDSPVFSDSKSKLTIALGKDISGAVMVTDITKMPHGLIAGATGSGKSVCINSLIISLLYKSNPDDVKFLMIDPKVVELGIYNGIPHLLVPVVTDPRKAAGALGWAVSEMEKRYKMFAECDVRNLEGYNRLAKKREDLTKMPHIVIIIDELADLMMTAPNEVEDSICRIAQKARAAGMHLIIATQRPSVDVVTGLIKANIPTRIAFAVSSQVDSRTILDMGGAEKLLGRGDMLFYPVGSVKPCRVQGCFVSDEEVESVVNFIKGDYTSAYDEEVMVEIDRQAAKEKATKSGLKEDAPDDFDPMLQQAIECVVDAGQASTSLLQRRLKLGYARAARIIDEMESRGIVGPYEGSKPRTVLISKSQLLEMQAGQGE